MDCQESSHHYDLSPPVCSVHSSFSSGAVQISFNQSSIFLIRLSFFGKLLNFFILNWLLGDHFFKMVSLWNLKDRMPFLPPTLFSRHLTRNGQVGLIIIRKDIRVTSIRDKWYTLYDHKFLSFRSCLRAHYISLNSISLYYVNYVKSNELCYIILYYIILYHIILHHIMSYFTIFYRITSYYNMLYYRAQFQVKL